jgi:hypothetical protein
LDRLLKAAAVTAESASSSAPSPKGRTAQKSS